MKKITVVAIVTAIAIIVAFMSRSDEVTAPGSSDITSSTPEADSPRSQLRRLNPGAYPQLPTDREDAGRTTIIPVEFMSPEPPQGTPEMPLPETAPSIYPGSIPADSVIDRYSGLLQWGSEHITASSTDDLRKCKLDFIARGGKFEKAYATVALRIVGDGERMEVVEVLADPSIWPGYLDEEIKTCLINGLLHRGAPSQVIADLTVDYPLCLDQPLTR